MSALDLDAVRADFPAFDTIYLDSAATCRRPWPVIHAVGAAMARGPGSAHGTHGSSYRAIEARERARARIASALGSRPEEIVFVRGATEGLNLVAQGIAIGRGDRIVISALEHHANVLPWRRLAARSGAELVVSSVEQIRGAIDRRTRLVAVTHASNVLGDLVDVAAIARAAHAVGARIVVDGAQAVGHRRVDLSAIDCDAYAFSGHKVYGPCGIGVLALRRGFADELAPLLLGGQAVVEVGETDHVLREGTARFEAGTPPHEGVIGLAAAFEWLEGLGREAIERHEVALVEQAHRRLGAIPGVRIVSARPASLVSFVLDGVHAHDVATILDAHGIEVRAGRMCAEPLLDRLGLDAVVRASFAAHTTAREIEGLAEAVDAARGLRAA